MMNDPKSHWNARFAEKEYAYGIKPNEFLAQQLTGLKPGKLLMAAEGEGRNAVYAATQGWGVVAFDISEEGKKKALKLAEENRVEIDYRIHSYDDFDPDAEKFDCIGLVFAHSPAHMRREYHRKLAQALKPRGTLILEGFSKNQLGKPSGGPPALEMLFSAEELQEDFKDLDILTLEEVEGHLDEGIYHRGPASLMRLVAKARD